MFLSLHSRMYVASVLSFDMRAGWQVILWEWMGNTEHLKRNVGWNVQQVCCYGCMYYIMYYLLLCRWRRIDESWTYKSYTREWLLSLPINLSLYVQYVKTLKASWPVNYGESWKCTKLQSPTQLVHSSTKSHIYMVSMKIYWCQSPPTFDMLWRKEGTARH